MGGSALEAFTEIYTSGGWRTGDGNDGTGSTHSFTTTVRSHLPDLLSKWQITSLFDAGCGDSAWIQLLDLNGISYIGGDIVKQKIENLRSIYPQHRWVHMDVVTDPLPDADVWLCRDTMIHLPLPAIKAALRNFMRSNIKYLLVGNNQNGSNEGAVDWGYIGFLNWSNEPWSFGDPLDSIPDSSDGGGSRALHLYHRDQINLGSIAE